MAVKWLDRSLVVSPYYFCLCTTLKQFHKELKRLKVPEKNWPDFLASACADATVHYFEKGSGELCAIVCIHRNKKHSIPQVYAMLVHEAVHIWQTIKATIGERDPSREFEAYSIQAISQRLMEAYDNDTKRQRTAKK
jgi:hypothetical protein